MIVTCFTIQDILSDNSVPLTARAVYVRMVHLNTIERGCFPGEERLAQELSIGIRTVRRALRELEDMAWIETVRRGATKTNTYRLKRYVDDLIVTGQNDPSPKASGQNDPSPKAGERSKRPVMSGQNDRQYNVVDTKKDITDTTDVVSVSGKEGKLALPPAKSKPKASTPKAPAEKAPDQEFVESFAAFVGFQPTHWGEARRHAKALLAAGCTKDDIPTLYQWLGSQNWLKGGGIDLRLMASQYDRYRSETQGPSTASPDQSPAMMTSKGANVRWIIEKTKEYERAGL